MKFSQLLIAKGTINNLLWFVTAHHTSRRAWRHCRGIHFFHPTRLCFLLQKLVQWYAYFLKNFSSLISLLYVRNLQEDPEASDLFQIGSRKWWLVIWGGGRGRQERGELQGRKHGWASYRWWVVGVSLAWVSGNLHTITLRASPRQTRRWIQPPAPTCRWLGVLYIGQVLLSLCRGCQGVLQVEEEHQVEWQVLEKEMLSVRESEGRVPNWPYWP